MHLIELFIAEKISLTNLKNPLKKEIHSEIIDSIRQIYYKEKKLDPGEKELANKQVSLVNITPKVHEWLKEQLTVRLALGIELVLKAVTGVDVKVRFIEMKTNGTASGRNINLNDKMVNDLTEKLVAMLYDYTLDTLEGEDEIVSQMFNTFKLEGPYLEREIQDSVSRQINELISVVIHEMVHVVQHDSQFKAGRGQTEYRSYLNKDKEKFYTSVRKLSTGDYTNTDYALYRGSPQEIAAFAHEAALKFIEDMSIDDIEDLDLLRKEIPANLDGYVESMFNDPRNRQEYAIFKRFHKLMYQEVISYLDQVEKRKKKELRKTSK